MYMFCLNIVGMAVLLTVQQFDLEGGDNCPYDWVSVYNNAGGLISTWCATDGNGMYMCIKT